MKPYAKEATAAFVQKFDIEHHSISRLQRKFDDGKVHATIPDKSVTMSSRPGSKRTIRNANRSQTKSARQRLKAEMEKEANESSD